VAYTKNDDLLSIQIKNHAVITHTKSKAQDLRVSPDNGKDHHDMFQELS